MNVNNELRNQIAGGLLDNYSTATRMAYMEWDDELAEMAALNVKACKYDHDQCRNTNNFMFSGQNIAMWPWFGEAPSLEELVVNATINWFSEYEICTMDNIKELKSTSKPVTGHFTVIAAELNVRVGCAAVDFSNKNEYYKFIMIACNYATNNFYGESIYRSGPAASKCESKSEKNPKYPYLCPADEEYNVNSPLPA